MTTYKIDKWRIDLIKNPPKAAQQFSKEEWEFMVLHEFLKAPNIFVGKKNGNYGNPTEYKHSKETKQKISENNARYWKNKTGSEHPSYGRTRDNTEALEKMWEANRGKPSWNSGKTGLYSHSEETKKKMSEKKKGIPKPKIECPHCGKIGGYPTMKQWHFNNCKEK